VKVAAGKNFAALHADAARRVLPDLQWVTVDSDGAWSGDPQDCSLAIYADESYTEAFIDSLTGMPELRWGHSEDAGIDGRFVDSLQRRGVLVTHSPGTNAPEVAEMALAFVLWSAKRLGALHDQQRAHRWAKLPLQSLSDRRVLVVGLGAIGGRIARHCLALGMTVAGIRRGADPFAGLATQGTLADLRSMAADADYVILAVPISADTERVVDASVLAAMPPDATLINVGRGALVDIEALATALRAGELAQACLDVVPDEPLPVTDPLWDVPNLFITPHNASVSPLYMRRVGAVWLDNLARFADGTELLNRVAPPV
jgi:phosphoglycerate dehydrogenase-like enzyme